MKMFDEHWFNTDLRIPPGKKLWFHATRTNNQDHYLVTCGDATYTSLSGSPRGDLIITSTQCRGAVMIKKGYASAPEQGDILQLQLEMRNQ